MCEDRGVRWIQMLAGFRQPLACPGCWRSMPEIVSRQGGIGDCRTLRMGRRDGMRQVAVGAGQQVWWGLCFEEEQQYPPLSAQSFLEPGFGLLHCHCSPSLRGTLSPSSSFPCTCSQWGQVLTSKAIFFCFTATPSAQYWPKHSRWK